MTPPSSRIHQILILSLLAATLLATWTPAGFRLESWTLRLASWYAPADAPDTPVTVIGLDGADDAALRRQAAAAVQRLHALGADAVGLVLPLDRSATAPAVSDLRRRAQRLEGDGPELRALRTGLALLDADATLAAALRGAGNVVIAAPLLDPDAGDLSALWDGGRKVLTAPPASFRGIAAPLPSFREAAAAVGVTDTAADGGVPLAVNNGTDTLPGIATLLAARLARAAARPAAAGDRLYRHPAIGTEGAVSFHSLDHLLSGSAGSERLARGALLIGPARDFGERRRLAELGASIAALTDGRSMHKPTWFHGALRGALAGIGFWLLFLPHRLRGWTGLALSTAVAAALVNVGALAALLRGVWLPTVTPALFLVAGQALTTFHHHRTAPLAAARADACAARRALAAALQEQGRLDAAFDQLRRCGADPQTLQPLQQLGLEYERRRQFPKALAVYEHLHDLVPDYGDIEQRRQHLQTVIAHLPTGAGRVPTSTVIVDAPGVENSTLGRYRLQRLLGRGAMGAVYLAEDPQIGRTVAVKVLPLSAEFEGELLEQARARLRREAEAAGRLQHPDIVTVFDAGEEHDLAYIAMDYAAGRNLEAFTQPDTLLPVADALEICARVAEALDYAHRQNVVHRDVKPSNILYDASTGQVKVTDFGVASLIDDRCTRTGAVLGSPVYMSPEQVAGRRLDGRSDLFSLGVTLYQLLTGKLPFDGDSLASISYRIVQQPHAPVSKVRKGLPACAGRIVNKVLQKDPAKRYASGVDLAAALRRCHGRKPRTRS